MSSKSSYDAKNFTQLQYYNQGAVGTVNEPMLGPAIHAAWGGIGFSAKTAAYQNAGGYATLTQAYPAFDPSNPKNQHFRCK